MKKTINAVLAAILCTLLVGPAALAAESFWKVGRAVVQKEAVKLSLRNDGRPSKEGVQILGRWTSDMAGGPVKPAELGEFRQLGAFSTEVELKKTAILEVPIGALGPQPQGKTHLELVIVTGRDITDSKVVD